MVDRLPVSKRLYVVMLTPDGTPYTLGEGIADSVTITGDALTALQTTATKTTAIALDTAAIALAIGEAADAAGDPTVIGLLKQIAENTTPA